MTTMMRAIVLLADSAQVDPSKKVHALGLGWSVTTTPTPPATLVVLLKVPWSETNVRHDVSLHLVDADGHPVMVSGSDDEARPLVVSASFEVGRPAGTPAGTPVDEAFAVNLGAGLALNAGQSYEWQLEIDGQRDAAWVASFHVRSPRPA
jgi:hypothetical protein